MLFGGCAMDNKNFIGMGHNPNPNVPDIPLGFGMALFKAPEARQNFENLSDDEKTRLIGYIQSNNATGQDAKHKIATAVENLKKGNRSFF
jgi:hypothetical protein